jgi:hypothetical protein
VTQKHQDDLDDWNYPDAEFAYSDDEWSKIIAELPENVDLCAIRFQMEMICLGHVMMLQIKDWHERRENSLKKFNKKADELLELWPSQLKARVDVLREGHPIIPIPQYVAFQEIVEWIKEQATPPHPPKRGPRPFARDTFIRKLIFLWAQIGGSLGTSTSPVYGRATGPIVRFLIAAANPVLEKNLSPDAARTLVRKYRKYNKPPYGELSRGW